MAFASANARTAACTFSSNTRRSIIAWRRTCWNGRMWIGRRCDTSSCTLLARLRTNQRALGINRRSSTAHTARRATINASHNGTVMLDDTRAPPVGRDCTSAHRAGAVQAFGIDGWRGSEHRGFVPPQLLEPRVATAGRAVVLVADRV